MTEDYGQQILDLAREYTAITGTFPFAGVENRSRTNKIYMFDKATFSNGPEALGYMRERLRAVQDSQPMKASELGRYVCVPSGSCLHRGLDRRGPMIDADGVWVRSPDPDPLNPGSYLYSSAHRDCYERRQASAKAAVSQPVLNEERAYLILTNTDPVTGLPLMSPDDAHRMLHTATHHGIATWRDAGRQVTVTSSDGVFFNVST